MSGANVTTAQVTQLVEEYVYSELSNAEKYDNRSPLDESGIWTLHRLAAVIYAQGFDDGERVEAERSRRAGQRERDKSRRAAETPTDGQLPMNTTDEEPQP